MRSPVFAAAKAPWHESYRPIFAKVPWLSDGSLVHDSDKTPGYTEIE
jgi:hypothetical protein